MGGEPLFPALGAPVRKAWCAQTSADPDNWTPENPAWGQCAVTALIVQDLCGGELLRTTVGGISHYFNELEDGRWVDLTRQQFPPRPEPEVRGAAVLDAGYDGPPEPRTRAYVLSYPATVARYRILKARIGFVDPDLRPISA